MNKRTVFNTAVVLAASLILTACGGEDKAELSRVAKKYNLDMEEKLAFKACLDLSGSGKPIIDYGSRRMVMQDVPIDVCGCQAKPMLKYMQPGKFGSYANFSRWLSKPERKENASLMRNDLKKGVDAKAATAALGKSFDACVASLVSEKPGLDKEILIAIEDDPEMKAIAEQKKKAQARAEAEKSAKIDW
jgi:hypothetical protein